MFMFLLKQKGNTAVEAVENRFLSFIPPDLQFTRGGQHKAVLVDATKKTSFILDFFYAIP